MYLHMENLDTSSSLLHFISKAKFQVKYCKFIFSKKLTCLALARRGEEDDRVFGCDGNPELGLYSGGCYKIIIISTFLTLIFIFVLFHIVFNKYFCNRLGNFHP